MRTRRWLDRLLLALVFAIGLSACCSEELHKELSVAEAVSGAFIKRMDLGETTRDQEQAFIRKTHETITKAKKAARE